MKILLIGFFTATLALGWCLSQTLPGAPVSGPTGSGCNLQAMKGEASDFTSQIPVMQARIVTLRVSAGAIQSFDVRNALQVDAELWQQLLDEKKHRLETLNAQIEKCSSGK